MEESFEKSYHMSFELHLFLILLISLSCAEDPPINCGTGHAYFYTGESREVYCTETSTSTRINPPLPSTMVVEDRGLRGQYNDQFAARMYTLRNSELNGFLFVTSGKELSYVTIGSSMIRVVSGVAMIPLRAVADSYVEQFTLSPELPSGLIFNVSTQLITGTYVGRPFVEQYTLTAKNKYNEVSNVFSIEYIDDLSSYEEGYSACFYSFSDQASFITDLVPQLQFVDSCSRITEDFDFLDNPVNDRTTMKGSTGRTYKTFGIFYSFLLHIPATDSYDFVYTMCAGTVVFIDDETEAEIHETGMYSEKSVTKTRKLTEGYHVWRVYITDNMHTHIQIAWGKSGAETEVLHAGVTYSYGYSPSMITKIDDVVVTSQVPFTQRLFKYKAGYISQIIISPPLPSGVFIDQEKGTIYGVCSTTIEKSFTMSAKNMFGESNSISFVLRSTRNLQHGLQRSVYQVHPTVVIRDFLWFDAWSTLVQKDIVRTPYQSVIQGYQAFPNIAPSVFANKLLVQWKGYIRVDNADPIVIMMSSNDGYEMIVDESFYCGNLNNLGLEKECSIPIPRPGYHSIVVSQLYDMNSFYFNLQMKYNDTFNPIPDYVFSYSSSASVEMTTSYATYTAHSAIPENKLLYAHPSHIRECSISPELPPGLQLSNACSITGTPEVAQERKEYTLQIKDKHLDSPLSVVVSIEINTMSPPSPIVLYEKNNELGHFVEKKFGEEINWTIQSNGTVGGLFSVTPALPMGMKLKGNKILGHTVENIVNRLYQFQCTNSAGMVSYDVYLTTHSCVDTDLFYVQNSMGSIKLKLTYNNETISEGSLALDHVFQMCLEKKVYQLYMKSNSFYDFYITRYDGIVVYSQIGSMLNATIAFPPPDTKIPFVNDTMRTFYLNTKETFSWSYTLGGNRSPLEYDALPLGFITTSTGNTGSLSGSWMESGYYTIQAECHNSIGKTTVKLEFYVEDCGEKETLFLERSTTREYDALIETESGEVVLNITRAQSRQLNRILFCVEKEASLKVTIKGDERKLGGVVRIRDKQNAIVNSFIVGAEEDTVEYIHLVRYDFKPWRFYNSYKNVDKEWFKSTYDDKDWNTGEVFGSFSQKVRTVYFRSAFTVTKETFTPSLYIDLATKGGFIVYINGEEGLRVNLPVTTISSATGATELIDMSASKRYSLSHDLLRYGTNVIAIELHCYASQDPTQQSIQMSLSSYGYSGSNTVYSEAIGYTSGDSVQGLMEGDDYHPYAPSDTPIIFHNEGIAKTYVNGLLVRCRANTSMEISVYGSNQETTGETLYALFHQEVIASSPDTYRDMFFRFTSYYGYESIRVIIKGASVEMTAVALFHKPILYCNEDEVNPKTPAASHRAYSCGHFEIGRVLYRCESSYVSTEWKKEENTCLTVFSGKSVSFIDVDYTLDSCDRNYYNTVFHSLFVKMIASYVMVYPNEIYTYIDRDCSMLNRKMYCFSLRLYPQRIASAYVLNQLVQLNTNITSVYHSMLPNSTSSIQIRPSSEVVLRERPDDIIINLFIVISVLSVLVIVLFSVVLNQCKKNRIRKRKTIERKVTKIGAGKRNDAYVSLI